MKLATCRVPVGTRGARIERIQTLGAWWVQFGDTVLLYTANENWRDVVERSGREDLVLEEIPGTVVKGTLYLVVQEGRLFQQEHPDVPVLLDRGRYLVVKLQPEDASRIGEHKEPCYAIEPLQGNTVVFDVRMPPAERRAPTAWVQTLVDSLDQTSFKSSLSSLVSHPTRYSTSSHYHDAATWAEQKLQDLGYTTSTHVVNIGSSTTRNIIAYKYGGAPGTRDLVLVVAHLDSINATGGPTANAPGADDNASGAAGLLELARVLKDNAAEHDLGLVLFGGEEQGLHGSKHYVSTLSATDRSRLVAVVNMDMIGNLNTPALTVLLEGATVSQSVVDDLADAASTYSGLTVQTSLSPYASDHVPFINAGLPAVLTIEGADSANSFIHTANDTINHIDYDLAMEILRMNVAFVATTIGRKGVLGMLELPVGPIISEELLENLLARARPSGKYTYNQGVATRQESAATWSGHTYTTLDNPIYELDEPIYVDYPTIGDPFWEIFKLRFTLHVDIDGPFPLNVVSGDVAKGFYLFSSPPPHFIGRVTSNTLSGSARNLVVEDFSFTWPGTSDTIDRLEIALTGGLFTVPTAEVTFVDTSHNRSYGPYTATRSSGYFREVEVEVDREDQAVDPKTYNTHTHPDRPATLPKEDLTLEKVFARAGIKITRSSSGNIINTSEAGPNNRWNYQELHDSMENHWSAFANIPQWKMWIFLAELADSDSLGGVMFDGYIDEPGGVDRQGTAVFTKCPFFHTAGGAYPQANPPAAEAAERELFFDLIHETGHAFNLAHSWQKLSIFDPGDSAWNAPSWMPVTADPQALSWMNYPDSASPGSGYNATWFYTRFWFRFEDQELLFLRHAPARFVRVGDSPWFQNHGRVSRDSLDRRLELLVRTRKPAVELGESVFIELRLRNVSNEPVIVHRNLDPSDAYVQIAITNPQGKRTPFIPIAHVRAIELKHVLEPNQRLYQAINLTVSQFGFPFKEPGPYRIEVSYRNLDGTTAAAVLRLWVRPPAAFDDLRVIGELFNARIGRVLYVGGTRTMEDVNEKIDWVVKNLGERHPAIMHLNAVRASPYEKHYKVLEATRDRIMLLDPNPDFVLQRLQPLVDRPEEAADSLGHIAYHQAMDTYTRAALVGARKPDALHALQQMQGMFNERGVVASVMEQIETQLNELR